MDCIVATRRVVLWSPARVKVARPRQIRVSASDHREPIELPGGAYWWLGANKSSSTVIYGENFVLERPRVGGPGLIPVSKQNVSVQRFKSPRSGPPAVRPHQPTSMILSGMVVLDTEFEEVFDVDLLDPAVSNTAESFPSTTCTGIVYVGSGENDTIDVQDVGAASSRHPRRTRRMRFTCNLCGEVNEKEVNPNAWRTGSVFARCEGCTAVHKLKDNLKIFHELRGPIFPPRELRGSFPAVKEILERIEAKRRME